MKCFLNQGLAYESRMGIPEPASLARPCSEVFTAIGKEIIAFFQKRGNWDRFGSILKNPEEHIIEAGDMKVCLFAVLMWRKCTGFVTLQFSGQQGQYSVATYLADVVSHGGQGTTCRNAFRDPSAFQEKMGELLRELRDLPRKRMKHCEKCEHIKSESRKHVEALLDFRSKLSKQPDLEHFEKDDVQGFIRELEASISALTKFTNARLQPKTMTPEHPFVQSAIDYLTNIGLHDIRLGVSCNQGNNTNPIPDKTAATHNTKQGHAFDGLPVVFDPVPKPGTSTYQFW